MDTDHKPSDHQIDLDKNEAELVKRLRASCKDNGSERDLHESASILHSLGKVYRKRSPDKLCLIQSAALLNAAMVRVKDTQEIVGDLQELHQHILQLAGCDEPHNDLQHISAKCFALVQAMRENAEVALQNLRENSDLTYDGTKKIEIIERLQQQVADDYLSVMKVISQECINILGTIPCSFSLVGIGSLARCETTPYSDFESVIVLEESAQHKQNYTDILEYFRYYTLIFQIVVLGFGETIVPCVAIPTLNNYEMEGGDWFFDTITPRGVSFDGNMPHACKTPLGRQRETEKKPWTLELIQPVSLMAAFLHLDSDIKNGYHLSDILTLVRFVDGDRDVFDDFHARVQNHVTNTDHAQSKMLMRQIKEDLDTFAVFNNLPNVHTNKRINIKRVIYRCTTLFVSTLGRLHGIGRASSFDILRELEKRGVITDMAKQNLMFAVAIACEVRLKVYMSKRGQDEWLLMDMEQKDNEANVIGTVGLDNILKYFKVAFCLQRAIRGGEKMVYNGDMLDVGKDVDVAICYYFKQYRKVVDLGGELRGFYLANESGMDKVVACTSLIADCLFHLGEYKDALLECNKEISYRTVDANSLPTELANCRKAVARCLFRLQRYEEAMEEHLKERELLEPSSKAFALCLENIGNCLFQMGLYERALLTFRHQFDTQELLYQEDGVEQGECLTNIAGCLFRMERFEEALDSYKQAKHTFCAMSKKKPMILLADCNGKLAHCYFKLGFLLQALEHYKLELQILQDETAVEQSSLYDSYSNVAGCCYSLKLFSESIFYYEQLLGDKFDNVDKIVIKNKIAACFMKTGDIEKALAIYRQEFEECQLLFNDGKLDQVNQPLFAKTVENITFCLLQLDRSQEAVDFFRLQKGAIQTD